MTNPDQGDMLLHMPHLQQRASQAGFILELGMQHGLGSTRAFYRGLHLSTHPDKLMVSVDCDPSAIQERPPYPFWRFVEGDTLQYVTLRKVQELCGERKADIIFIDTEHTYAHLTRELEVWRNISHPDTIWIFHDTWMEGPHKEYELRQALLDYVKENPPLYYKDITRESFGLGEMRRFIGINAGSGQRPFPQKYGWINLDVQPKSYQGHVPDIVADMRSMPFPDNYADCIVSSHTLEHLGCGDADGFIKEAHRVLKTDGKFIISLPDIRALAIRWLRYQLEDYLYIVNLMGAYQGNEADRHRWHYTKESLTKLLTSQAHWSHIGNWDKQSVQHMDLAQDWWIMTMEAVK